MKGEGDSVRIGGKYMGESENLETHELVESSRKGLLRKINHTRETHLIIKRS